MSSFDSMQNPEQISTQESRGAGSVVSNEDLAKKAELLASLVSGNSKEQIDAEMENDVEKEAQGMIKAFKEAVIVFEDTDFTDDNLDDLRLMYSALVAQDARIRSQIYNFEIYDGLDELKGKQMGVEVSNLSNQAYQKMKTSLGTLFSSEMIDGHEVSTQVDSTIDLESIANFDGNMTEVMVERLNNPLIRGQLIRLVSADQKYKLKKEGDSPVDPEVLVQERIDMIVSDTPVTFDNTVPYANTESRENMGLLFKPDRFPEYYGVKQKSIIEAHEKGHMVRQILGEGSFGYFEGTLDFSQITVTEEHFQARRNMTIEIDGPDAVGEDDSREEHQETTVEYLRSPLEIIERMSQLKNYFGFVGDEVFTKNHLDYAREHYIEDTKIDNDMTEFFQAITSETEKRFLEIINNSGI